ncbi:amino acid adenylation domain-containing protein [Microbispora cellulosiformans]|uniref:Amino acid adenylation domain-containing protein n=1 Tax=Microbispora cellulosiformans TaxID=2614688 RepID=A0A5J5K1S3_9ACTN|nr:amino acid adenylation domain-containing protein [Microbispora cellulosiformans]
MTVSDAVSGGPATSGAGRPGTDAATALALIRRWRDESPDAVAVSGDGGVLTYRELLDRADRLAALLRARGVGPEVPVGLCLERCPGMVVALLAVWRAGGAYVPLDPAFPEDRLRHMREDAGIRLVLAGKGVGSALLDGVPDVVELAWDGVPLSGEGQDGDGDGYGDGAGPVGDLAYLMYTSGSTGRPKGVAVPNGAVVNLLESFASLLELTPRDAWLAVTTLSFDISVLELLLPLACGARVVVASAHETTDGRALRSRAVTDAVTIMQATPASWRILIESGGVPANIATRLCGGEALPRDLADTLLADGARLWNVYGPTETTVWSTAGRVAPSPAPVDLGEPIGNTTVHILGPDGRPVPPGEAGELHIGGAGLARGYRGMPGQTADRFRPDPFSATPGARLYATGDLAALENGRLRYLGRADQQVKVRGFRIELGEIETVLRAAPEVAGAAVGVHAGPDGLARLVAYVVRATTEHTTGERTTGEHVVEEAAVETAAGGTFRGTGSDIDEADLWAALRDRLRLSVPEYMVPARLVVLDALPLTPNGKLDRAALPAPEWTRAGSRPYRPPSTPLEEDLAALWGEVLGIAEPVGVDDDFFELGGHSLTATQIIARIQARFAISVPIVELFENPTVAGLAAAMDRLDDDDLDLAEIAALRDELDGLSAEDLAAVLDGMSDR